MSYSLEFMQTREWSDLVRDTFKHAHDGKRARSYSKARAWFDYHYYTWLEVTGRMVPTEHGQTYQDNAENRKLFAASVAAKVESKAACLDAVDTVMSASTTILAEKEARAWINEQPVEYVGCPGCGYRAGHHHTKTCTVCEECSTCCRCEPSAKRHVPLAEWVPILRTRL